MTPLRDITLPLLLQHSPLTLHLHSPHPRRLALSGLTPALRAHITATSDPDAPRAVITPGSPRPARPPSDGQVVEPETEPRARDTDQAAEQDVEAEVTIVDESGGADVDCGANGDEDEDEGVNGWGGVLVADGDDVVVGEGEGRTLLGIGERGHFLEVRRCDGRGVVGVGRVRARREEGDCNREFGGEEERQVEEAGPGNWIVLASV
jgi:hypothetical protein